MSNKFEIGKTYVVVKPFHYHTLGDEFTVKWLCESYGDVLNRSGDVQPFYVANASRLIDGYVKLKEENVMSNTITQLEQQAADLQNKLDEMKATIEQQKQAEQESKKKENVFGLGVDFGQQYYYFSTPTANVIQTGDAQRQRNIDNDYTTAFNDKAKAEAMAEAFNVLLELRACEGVVKAVAGETQYYIRFNKDGVTSIDCWNEMSGFLSPFFESNKAAQDALNKVGKERVRKAFLTMQGTF